MQSVQGRPPPPPPPHPPLSFWVCGRQRCAGNPAGKQHGASEDAAGRGRDANMLQYCTGRPSRSHVVAIPSPPPAAASASLWRKKASPRGWRVFGTSALSLYPGHRLGYCSLAPGPTRTLLLYLPTEGLRGISFWHWQAPYLGLERRDPSEEESVHRHRSGHIPSRTIEHSQQCHPHA